MGLGAQSAGPASGAYNLWGTNFGSGKHPLDWEHMANIWGPKVSGLPILSLGRHFRMQTMEASCVNPKRH
jgi:hypothetical protein